jgi:hypothetical protein
VQQAWSHPFSFNKLIVTFLLTDAKHMSSNIRFSLVMYAETLAIKRDNSATPLTVWEMLLAKAFRIIVNF